MIKKLPIEGTPDHLESIWFSTFSTQPFFKIMAALDKRVELKYEYGMATKRGVTYRMCCMAFETTLFKWFDVIQNDDLFTKHLQTFDTNEDPLTENIMGQLLRAIAYKLGYSFKIEEPG